MTPRFPFGHGLSYATFEYGPLNVERSGDEVRAAIEVTNTGDVAGKEVVQLYVTDSESSVQRPAQELKAFEKISLAAGRDESRPLHARLPRVLLLGRHGLGHRAR